MELSEFMQKNGYEFIIVGDTVRYPECLMTLHGTNLDRAMEQLKEFRENPDSTRRFTIDNTSMTNCKILVKVSADCWWNQGTD